LLILKKTSIDHLFW